MREILFRGKRVSDIGEPKEWIEGYLFRFGEETGFEENYILGWLDHRDTIYDIWKCAEKVSSKTIGQFTGLTDKNGKKIFEGDIVRYDYGNVRVVTFYHGRYSPFNSYPEYNCWRKDECEIIGNIHDNPELMGGE